jgi:hypothetical protein
VQLSEVKLDASDRIAFVVAGMHRSGTSPLTRVLSACGHALPKTLLKANTSNEAGFWESTAVNRLNDKILESATSNWRSWRPLPADWLHASNISSLRNEALATLRAEFGTARSFVLKDPRFCRLMRFWFPIFADLSIAPFVVCPIRNPLESAASLEKRNSLPQSLGLLLWLRYQLDLEFDTRGRPRAFTHYDALLEDWRQVVAKIMAETGVTLPRIGKKPTDEMTSWLSPNLRHHQFSDAAALHDTKYPEWVRSAYAVFLKWSRTQEDEHDYGLLDRIRSEFNAVPPSLSGILDAGQRHIDETRQLRKKIESLGTRLAESARQVALHDTQAKVYGEQFAVARASVEDSVQRLAQRDADARAALEQLQESKSRLAAVQKQKDDLSLRLNKHDVKLIALERSLKKADALRRKLEQRQERTRHQLAQREAEARLYAARHVESQEMLSELSKNAKELREQLAAREATLRERDDRLTRIEVRYEEALGQLAKKEAEARLFSERYIEVQVTLDHLGNSAKELQRQLVRQDAERRRHAEDLRDQQERVAELAGQIKELQQQLDTSRSVLSRKDREIVNAVDEARRARKESADSKQEMEARYGALRKEADSLKRKLLDARKTRDTTVQEREIAKQKVVGLEQELNRIRSSLAWRMARTALAVGSRLTGLFLTSARRKQRKLVRTISTSPLFDGVWYRARNPDAARKRIDPALHYLHFGARAGRDPGPDFSTMSYLKRYPDVARDGMNPLVHYERFGRKEERLISPAEPDAPTVPTPQERPDTPKTTQKFADTARLVEATTPGFRVFSMPLEHLDTEFAWLTQTELLRMTGECQLLLGGLALARAGGADASSRDLAPDAIATIEIFARLNGMPEDHGLRWRVGESMQAVPLGNPSDTTGCNVHVFRELPIQIDAVWFSNSRDLRVRFNAERLPDGQNPVARGYQYDPGVDGGLAMLGEHGLSRTSMQTVDFAPINPYFPVLLTLTTPDGRFVAASLLPFPSLCPGGAHECERFASTSTSTGDLASLAHTLLTEHLRASDVTGGWALARIMIDVREATGAERVFSTDFREWLWCIFAMRLEAWRTPTLDPPALAYWHEVLAAPASVEDTASVERHARRARGGQDLICPPGAFPSVHALTTCLANRGLERICSVGAYVIAQQGNASRRWLVNMPLSARNPDRAAALAGSVRYPIINCTDDGPAAGAWRSGAPIAILERELHLRHPSQLIMPVAPDIRSPLVAVDTPAAAGKVTVIITTSDVAAETFAAMLESLQLQRDIEVRGIMVATLPDSARPVLTVALERYFPQRHRFLECADGEDYADRVQRAAMPAAQVDGETCLLFINRAVVLHDPRTLSTLSRLASMDRVATASCLLIGTNPSTNPPAVQARFSGVLAMRETTTSRTECVELDAQALFPLDTYPVASNGDALFMMKAGVWQSVGGFRAIRSRDQRAAIELSAALAESGLRHLFTTRVSAEIDSAPPLSKERWAPSEEAARALHTVSTCIEALPT